MPRLFVALDLPPRARAPLAAVANGIPGARWVAADALHLTLRFIGDVDFGLAEDIVDALTEIRRPAFSLRLAGVGFFPPAGPPRQLWAGVEDNPPLEALRRAVEGALVAVGMAPERRKFVPHVTLARLDAAPLSRVARFLSAQALLACEPVTIEAFHLYSSRLHRQGARYRIEASFALA